MTHGYSCRCWNLQTFLSLSTSTCPDIVHGRHACALQWPLTSRPQGTVPPAGRSGWTHSHTWRPYSTIRLLFKWLNKKNKKKHTHLLHCLSRMRSRVAVMEPRRRQGRDMGTISCRRDREDHPAPLGRGRAQRNHPTRPYRGPAHIEAPPTHSSLGAVQDVHEELQLHGLFGQLHHVRLRGRKKEITGLVSLSACMYVCMYVCRPPIDTTKLLLIN